MKAIARWVKSLLGNMVWTGMAFLFIWFACWCVAHAQPDRFESIEHPGYIIALAVVAWLASSICVTAGKR